jgi:hypothetical protein
MKEEIGSLKKKKKNKIDRLLANLTKIRKEKTQTNKIRNVKAEIAKTPW